MSESQPRHSRPVVWLEDLRRDVSHGCRGLVRTPAFTITAILTLALGIGANTAIFSVIEATLLRLLPVAEPERLVMLTPHTPRKEARSSSYPLFEQLKTERTAFVGMFAVVDGVQRLEVRESTVGGAEEAGVQLVSGEYFDVLGVKAAAGRLLQVADDARPAGTEVAVLSHEYWTRRFGANPAVVGAAIAIKDQPFTVVGVAPPGFFGETIGRAPDIWVPLMMQPRLSGGQPFFDAANVTWLEVFARLARGVTEDRARASLALAVDRLRASSSPVVANVAEIVPSSGSRGLPGLRVRFSLPLQVLAGIVAVILLIACANVANLMLARAWARQQELAVRLAIGASRRRVIRQLLAEGVVLASLGGAAAFLIAYGGSNVLLALASSDDLPVVLDVSPNVTVLAFTAAVSLAAVLAFAVAPAVIASKVEVNTSLKTTPVSVRRGRFPSALVVAQVALSLLLLTGSALFVQTLQNLRARDFGYAVDSLVQVNVALGLNDRFGDRATELSRRLVADLSAAPGVQAVSAAGVGWGTGMPRTCCLAIEASPYTPSADRIIRTIGIAPGYFATMRLPIVRGRDFGLRDKPSPPGKVPTTAIVNEAFVKRYLPGGKPVGQRFGLGDPAKVGYPIEIVGVVRDAIYAEPRQEAIPLVYTPSAEGTVFVVRTTSAPDAVLPVLRDRIREAESGLDFTISVVRDRIEGAVTQERLLARLSVFFAILAAALAAIGLYGMMSYSVVRRTRELGIRLALGASVSTILRGEMRSALRLTAAGIALGVPAALLTARMVAALLFGVSPTNPATITAGAILLAAVVAAAAFLPARRASRVDPLIALRYE